MINQPTFRSLVFKMAHAIRSKFKNWSDCLKAAWKAFKLHHAMKTGIVNFTFRKSDGTIRYAKGTLNVSYESKSTRKPNYKTVTFFDTLIEQWRSFSVGALIQTY